MVIELLTLATFFLVTGSVGFVAWRLLKLRRDPIRDRLATVAFNGSTSAGSGRLLDQELVESLAAQLPSNQLDNGELDKDLRAAGYYKPTARREYLALRNGMMIFAAITTGVIAVAIGPERQEIALQVVIGGLIVVTLCWSLPRVYVSLAARRRVDRIRRGLPNALDLLSMCLSGGLTLRDALVHVSRELYIAHPDTAVEFLIVRQQTEMMSLDLAFQRFSERIDAPEIASVASLIRQTETLGTNVAATIRDYADNIRLQRRQTADEQAGKTSVKLLVPVTLCLLPAAMILLIGPSVLELLAFFRDEFGGPLPPLAP